MIGDIFGIVEQGAVVRVATAGVALSIADCAAKNFATMITFRPYVVQGSMSVSFFL
jgi:hypothetical protein